MKAHLLTALLLFVAGSAAAQSLQVAANGNVGVGTSTPVEKLEVAGNLKVNSAVLSPAGSAPMFVARAWVNFDGTGAIGADQVIRAAGNVSRVLKTANGTYTIYFTTPMQDGNACVTGNACDVGNGGGKILSIVAITATQVQVQATTANANIYNSPVVTVVCFR